MACVAGRDEEHRALIFIIGLYFVAPVAGDSDGLAGE